MAKSPFQPWVSASTEALKRLGIFLWLGKPKIEMDLPTSVSKAFSRRSASDYHLSHVLVP